MGRHFRHIQQMINNLSIFKATDWMFIYFEIFVIFYALMYFIIFLVKPTKKEKCKEKT